MALKLYNTLTNKKEKFRPLGKVVKMYNCGPTVYDYVHIGNLRTYTFVDILRRYLEYRGFKVKQVMNFTDVGHLTQDDLIAAEGRDKMEVAAQREKKTPWDIADFYIKAFMEDSRKLNFKEPEVRPRATQHIQEMIDLTKKLIDNGHAYEANGSVYYDVASFPEYGKLSGNTIEKLKAGAGGRVEHNPDKKNQFDFSLWIHDPKHLMKWDSPWGVGYPGWHIECSAMCMKHLGETLDIHTGGEDNIFPHHESEIAQSKGATGKNFSRFWIHSRHLIVYGEKMSKSKGNFYTLKDLMKKGYDPKAVRYYFLSSQYRSKLNFTEEDLKGYEKVVERLKDFVKNLENVEKSRKTNKAGKEFAEKLEMARKGFEEGMDDDLNTPKALKAIFDLMNFTNRNFSELDKKTADRIREQMLEFDKILGLELHKVQGKLPEWAEKLIKEREEARKNKNFGKADRIRSGLYEKGIIIEDTEEGTKWKIKKK